MRALCPNDANHKEFETTVHVQELWRVDEYGRLLGVIQCLGTVATPDHSNMLVCCECGAVATHAMD